MVVKLTVLGAREHAAQNLREGATWEGPPWQEGGMAGSRDSVQRVKARGSPGFTTMTDPVPQDPAL